MVRFWQSNSYFKNLVIRIASHKEIDTKIRDFGKDVQQFLKRGRDYSATDYLQAQQIKKQLKLDF